MYRKKFQVTSDQEGDILDITKKIQDTVSESHIREGLVHVFVRHSTAALTTIEMEPGMLSDLKRSLSILAPDDLEYAHNTRWGDGNGRSHVKAALVGPSLVVPVENGQLLLGTWQQIVMLELDVNAGREREIVCSVIGE
jgi:secondary thiamine-phosphate synthase enzyme